MSVWAHVGAAELLRVWVHWLWFKKTNRTKGSGGCGGGASLTVELSEALLSGRHWTTCWGPNLGRLPGRPRRGSPATARCAEATSV